MELHLDGSDWQLIHLMPTEWVWRQVWKEDWEPSNNPAAGLWINGTVPGDVISDALDAGLIANPYVDMQSRAAEWTSERDWVYRKRFDVPRSMSRQTVRLQFTGVDYTCHVYLNGQLLGKHDGMFVPFEFDVSQLLRFGKSNTLVVVVEHMPPVNLVQGQIGWSSEARIWKSRFAYNWDWCTRLVPLGIWQSVRVIATDKQWLSDAWVRTSVDQETATLTANISSRASDSTLTDARVRLRIVSPAGKTISKDEFTAVYADGVATVTATVPVTSPELWFPNGMGAQPIYRAQVELLNPAGKVLDDCSIAFGIRTIRAIANTGAAKDALPYTLEVNGRPMFVKGWNWAPIDNLYGRPLQERYERLLKLARHAHCNLLRVWGGGLLERESFYDLCDRLGILVWQEFHQSSSGINNRPPEDDAYLQYIEQQARQMIPLRRNHPSLAIWCGGNELMSDDGVPLNDQHPALARLKLVVHELDPDRLWLPTSSTGPVFSADPRYAGTGKMHDVHGPWQYLGAAEHYQFYNKLDSLYHSEFGAEGAANVRSLRTFISEKYIYPPDATNPAWIHHGSWWMHREKLEMMFGRINDIETFVRASQWMQAEGLRYAIESNRRRKWQCSGTSPWQLNEAFPNTACTNSIDYLGDTKPAYWWIRRAYEPVHISARYDRITWEPRQKWHAEIWINNSLQALPACTWSVDVMDLHGVSLGHTESVLNLADNAAIPAGEISVVLPTKRTIFLMLLTLVNAEGVVLSRNEYIFSTYALPFKTLLNAPTTTLVVKKSGQSLSVRNTGMSPALFVQLLEQQGNWIVPSDDYFCLAPGAKREVSIDGSGTISICAWNSAPVRVKVG